MRIKLTVLITLGFITFVTGGYTCPFTESEMVVESGSNVTSLVAPANLAARAVTKSRIDLTWEDKSTNEMGFRIERREEGSSTFYQIGLAGINTVKYSNTGITARMGYYYRVIVYNYEGEVVSNEVFASNAAPNPPTNLSAVARSYTDIMLSWDDSNNETGFKIYRNTTGSFGESDIPIKTVGANTTSYSDTGLIPGTTYYYRVKAYSNLFGDSGASPVASAPTLATSDMAKTWGGNGDDVSNDMVLDSGANVYLCGKTRSFGAGNEDALFIKYNSAGTIIQQKAWGGANLDEATGIALDTDGNIYVIGNTYNFGARGSAIFLLQYKDSDGSLQWQKKWDGVVNDFVRDMAITSSGIYLTGETESGGQGGKDILLLKYNFGGSVQWAKAWGDTRSNTAYGIDSDSADNIYICGSTSISSTIDSLLLKYNSSGTLVWSKIWRNDQTEIGRAVAVDPSSSAIYVVGETNSEGASDYDALIMKYGSDGSLIWVKRWGGNFKDTAYGVSVDSLGDVYVTGVTSSFGSSGSAFLLTYTSSGDLQRAMIWDGTLSDKGYSIASDTYCIFVAGSSQNGSTQGAWQNVAGTSATVFGNPEDIIGITADISSGVESGGITGAEISLTGLENGAGGDDSLLLRLRK